MQAITLAPGQDWDLLERQQAGDQRAGEQLVAGCLRAAQKLASARSTAAFDREEALAVAVAAFWCAIGSLEADALRRKRIPVWSAVKSTVNRDLTAARYAAHHCLSAPIGAIQMVNQMLRETDNDIDAAWLLFVERYNERLSRGSFYDLARHMIGGVRAVDDITAVAEEAADPTAQTCVDRARTDAVHNAVADLDERQAQVLTLRFGLTGDEPLTDTDTAAALGLSRRQVGIARERGVATLKTRLAEVAA
ncbi:sigma factor-like helix-turn-helix DNA-binding protein [Crossiella sp. NPDC003009]